MSSEVSQKDKWIDQQKHKIHQNIHKKFTESHIIDLNDIYSQNGGKPLFRQIVHSSLTKVDNMIEKMP